MRPAGAYDPDTLSVGVFGRPHGIRGELLLRTHNLHRPSDLGGLKRILVAYPDGRRLTHDIVSLRAVADGYLVRLAGVGDREAAAALTLGDVRVPRAALPALAAGEFYVDDIIGCAVESEDGHPLGLARATFWNGAHDVCAVDDAEGRERLIPLVPDFVLDVDAPGRKMRVRWKDDD